MLSKTFRVPAKEIANIMKKGKKIQSEGFYTKIWFDNSLPNPQFVVVVSTKVDKRAAIRNRIKRRFRSIAHELIKENKIKNAKYVVFVLNKSLMDLDYDLLKANLSKNFSS